MPHFLSSYPARVYFFTSPYPFFSFSTFPLIFPSTFPSVIFTLTSLPFFSSFVCSPPPPSLLLSPPLHHFLILCFTLFSPALLSFSFFHPPPPPLAPLCDVTWSQWIECHFSAVIKVQFTAVHSGVWWQEEREREREFSSFSSPSSFFLPSLSPFLIFSSIFLCLCFCSFIGIFPSLFFLL